MSNPLSTSLSSALIEMERGLGSGRVITDRQELEKYARDESEVQGRMPEAVVRASSAADVVKVMRAASRHGVPVTPRGAGTGRTGGSVPVQGGIVLAFEQMNRIKGIETENLVAVVEPGVITGELHKKVEARRLFYPPDPNSLGTCQIGGNIAENAGGPRAFRYGVTRDYVLGLQVVTAEGALLKLGKRTFKGVSGYDLTALVVGSEGTLAVVTEATLKLIPLPEAVATLMVLLADLRDAQSAVNQIVGLGIAPRCIELLDDRALSIARAEARLAVADKAQVMLLVELDGETQALAKQVERCGNAAQKEGALQVIVARDPEERERLWAARREMSRSLRRLARHKVSEDVVVPISRIADLLETCRRMSQELGIAVASHGHAGDGNLHVNLLWNRDEQRPAIDKAIGLLFETVIEMGGTISGEHGIGASKAPYLGLEHSSELLALQKQVKNLFDPRGILNPGKIFAK